MDETKVPAKRKTKAADGRPRMPQLRQARSFKVDVPQISHGYNNRLVVTLYPTGAMEIREIRRKDAPVLLELGQLYVNARVAEALQKLRR